MSVETLASGVAEARFHAMGDDAHLVLVGGDARLLDDARAHLELLDARWSRLRMASELSRLDARPGRPVVVARDTLAIIAHAVDAWQRTAGRFDPTVMPALRAPVLADADSPGCAGIVLDTATSTVTLPRGTTLDVAGIAKGFAADLVASALVAAGARGACAEIGAAVRVVGTPAMGDAWTIAVADAGELYLARGAVATARAGRASVTVLAAEAWWAEALAKAASVAGVGAGAQLVCDAGATGWFVHADGRVEALPGLDAFRA